jgi:hypothetical protein
LFPRFFVRSLLNPSQVEQERILPFSRPVWGARRANQWGTFGWPARTAGSSLLSPGAATVPTFECLRSTTLHGRQLPFRPLPLASFKTATGRAEVVSPISIPRSPGCFRARCFRTGCFRTGCFRAGCFRSGCFRSGCFRGGSNSLSFLGFHYGVKYARLVA